ncbi:hypothetical protein [Diaminobutyricimonas sp. LJ205]|nr:hypothetical protein [Diaminobutyricimonas sp. LJ205]
MSLLATIVTASTEHELAPLIVPAPVIGGIMALLFIVLGMVTFSYRDVANRHRDKAAKHDQHTRH